MSARTRDALGTGTAGAEAEGAAGPAPVILYLLLDLGHGRLLSFTERDADVLTGAQTQVWWEPREDRNGASEEGPAPGEPPVAQLSALL